MSHFSIDGYYNLGSIEFFEQKAKDPKLPPSKIQTSKLPSTKNIPTKISPKTEISSPKSTSTTSPKVPAVAKKIMDSITPAVREFSKEVYGALLKGPKPRYSEDQLNRMSPIERTSAELERNNSLRFYDRSKNLTAVHLTNNNDICITRNDKTVCIPDKDFVFKPNNRLQEFRKEYKRKQISDRKYAERKKLDKTFNVFTTVKEKRKTSSKSTLSETSKSINRKNLLKENIKKTVSPKKRSS